MMKKIKKCLGRSNVANCDKEKRLNGKDKKRDLLYKGIYIIAFNTSDIRFM